MPAETTTGIPEREYQAQLAALIKRYDAEAAPGTKESADAWEHEWQDLLIEASESQANRALDLLQLHVLNRFEVPADAR